MHRRCLGDHGRSDHNGAEVSSEIQRDRCLVCFLGVPNDLPTCCGGGQSARADSLQANCSHVRQGTGLWSASTRAKNQTTLSYLSDTRKAFLAQEASLPKGIIVVVTNLGKGVAAYLVLPDVLHVQDGTLECVIATEVSTSQAREEALAKVLLKSYW